MIDALNTRDFSALRLAGNQLTVTIEAADDAITPRSGLEYRLTLMVPTAYNSGGFEELISLTGREYPAGSDQPGASFELQTLLDSLLQRSAPQPDMLQIRPCTGLTMPFYITSEILNNDVVVSGSELTGAVETILKAKLSTEQFPVWGDAFFTRYLADTRQFLTWAPVEQEIDTLQPIWLYWLVNCNPKPIELRLRVELTFADGARQVITALTTDGITANTVYSMPAGFGQLNLPAYETDENLIFSYKVWLSDEMNRRLSQVRTFFVSARTPRNVRYLVFANSLGGFDTIRCTGQGGEVLKINETLSRRPLETGYLPESAELFVSDRTADRLLTINTGNAYDRTEIDYWQELALTEQAYIVAREGLIAVVVTADSYKLPEDDENLGGRAFAIRRAKTEVGYSNLPVMPAIPAGRPTIWVPKDTYCVIDPQTGIRTGQLGAAKLQLYYADTYLPVPGVRLKNNVPDTAGYVAPETSAECTPGSTPFLNSAGFRAGSFARNDCPSGVGEKAVINLLANTLGGNTAAELAARVEAYYKQMDTQAYANANGACTLNPWAYTMTVGGSLFNLRANDPAALSVGSYPGRAYGNGWDMQANIADPYVYAPSTNDMLLPVSATTYDMTLSRLNGKYSTVKLYRNGTLLQTIVLGNFGKTIRLTDYSISLAGGDKLYVYFY